MAEAVQPRSSTPPVSTAPGGTALGAMAAALLVASAACVPESLPRLSICFFHSLTGLPCPGCGLTRSFCAISHGDLAGAWAYNPFGLLFYALAVWLLLRPLLAWRWPAYVGWEHRVVASRAFCAAPIVLVTVMLVFGAWRILRLA